jgi:hypothetical protein
MASRSSFTTIITEGGLLPAEFLTRLAQQPDNLPGTGPDDYHLTPGRRVRDALNRSWTELQGAWDSLRGELAKLPKGERATTLTRERWLLPLFAELGFGRLPKATTVSIDGRDYPITHMWGAIPIHLLGADVELDRRTKGIAGAATAAPQSMLQEFLNRSDDHLWGLLSNGRRLRVLRDNTSLTRAAYVEFDLEAMFAGQVFSDFAVLWMVCHQSRFEADRPNLCWLELWIAEARQQGVRALDSLRAGFEQAITALGAGFLAHPSNIELKQRLRGGGLEVDDYYRMVLRLVYRLVFLLVAEDRRLLHLEPTPDNAKDRYARFYSLNRLRDHAHRHGGGRHGDLWESLKPLFTALGGAGLPALGLPYLGSFLWSDEACLDINNCRLSNHALLTAIRALAYTERDNMLRKVDFINLGPEELGSVYESLLELQPRIEANAGRFSLLSPALNERKSTGSYYTPTPLIIKVLDSTLEPVLDTAERHAQPEKALFALRVLDPACGSGHFLIAAGRRIATRIAAVRTGELVPPPVAVRHALREVVSRCLYGIDSNPMAVELCKINLWMEAIDPGLPLSFLESHIVLGNALLGASPANLARGLPAAAFKPTLHDDSSLASARRRRNDIEHRGQQSLFDGDMADLTTLLRQDFQAFTRIGDDTAEALASKSEGWERVNNSTSYARSRLASDAWCAAFVLPKTHQVPIITEGVIFAALANLPVPPETREAITSAKDQFRFLHPHLVFSDVFAAGGFDVLLGNPPWLSYSGRQKVSIEPAELNLLGFLYPEISSWPSSHSAFMCRSLDLLKDEGRCGLLAPLQVMHLERYGRLRGRLAAQADVVVEDVGENAFEGVSQRVGIYSMQRRSNSDRPTTWNFIAQLTAGTEDQDGVQLESQDDQSIKELVSLLRHAQPVPFTSFADPGVHTGNVSKLIVSNKFPDDDPQFAPVREGRDLRAFFCGPPQKRLWTHPELEPDQYCTIRPLELYISTPILLRQTADRPIACRHSEPTYFRNSVLACRGIKGVPDEVLVAVLNSALIRCWYQADVQESGQRAFPQVKVGSLRRLPSFCSERLDDSIDGETIRDGLGRLTLMAEAGATQSTLSTELSISREIELRVAGLYGLPANITDYLVSIHASINDPTGRGS